MKPYTHALRMMSMMACCAMAACAHGGGEASRTPDGGPTLTASTRLRIAEAAEQGGDHNLAATMYSQADHGGGADAATQIQIADGLARNGRIDSAEKTLMQALQANPKQPDLLRALGLIYVVAGRPEQALVQFDRALAARPGDPRSTVDKAVALDLAKRHGEAQALYRQALATAPSDAEIRTDLAISLMLDGKVAEAVSLVEPLSDEMREPSRVTNNIGVVLAAGGRGDTAQRVMHDGVSQASLTAFTQAIAQSP